MDNAVKYHTHIESKHNLLDFNLKEVWRYKDLIWLFTKRSFMLRYKQTWPCMAVAESIHYQCHVQFGIRRYCGLKYRRGASDSLLYGKPCDLGLFLIMSDNNC